MHSRELPLALLTLLFINTSATCVLRNHITALTGEPFYLKHCSTPSKHENEKDTIRWFKYNTSLGRIELSPKNSPRFAFHDYVLEFWPVEFNDSGRYIFKMGNETREWNLNVIKRNNHKCFTEKRVTSKVVEVKKYLKIQCENDYFKNRINRTLLYKDCKQIAENNENPLNFQKNAEFEDEGYYTCVLSLNYNGKLFNVTKTINITISGDRNTLSPVIFGSPSNYVKVKLGKDVRLNCSALLNENDVIYWLFPEENATYGNIHEESEVNIMTPEGQFLASRILRIENINENNLNFPYNCTVGSAEGKAMRVFILVKQEDTDISTRGMIVAILLLVAVVCILIVCAIYRVDLALLYRRLIGRDETLTDGKTYDAFVSYLKECQTENCEEHTFAVEILPRVLEKHFGYKLCIFERDVMPGGAVVDEVHSLIEKSRRLIIVLSENYMSHEVRFELESGLHEALVERKIKIILIEFTPISDFMFLPQSLELLKSHRVLKWKAGKSLSYNSRFWKNLHYLMPAKTSKPGRYESEILPVLSQT
ncbi:PREDICTED: interleukin-18 receptor 1 isoform X1 [Chrysochloris asiatica]|uniref:Interleukin-18 receptor 1 n=1 Tax=Chrysochloris asiatica TaxID=185453 RepID=A0A9B0WWR9_CHRAS|nr:PREDICTED: interleukin-18 receptor 1 isoform X1 [Chrysochloris asiatica]